MDTLEAIRNRRTIGKSTGDVAPEQIRELIEAATWAPNHKLTQPWKFNVVTGAGREQLGAVWGAAASAHAESAVRDAIRDGEARKLLRSPAVIVVSTRTDPDWVRAEEDLTATAAGVQNMLLAAHARGLSAAWKTGKIVHNAEVKAFLGLDPTDKIVAFVYLGAHAGEDAARRNRDVDGVITWMDGAALPV
jgi:nitroreductase